VFGKTLFCADNLLMRQDQHYFFYISYNIHHPFLIVKQCFPKHYVVVVLGGPKKFNRRPNITARIK
jgi:hypothetical protein